MPAEAVVTMKQHSPGFLALVNDAKTRVRQITAERYKEEMFGDSRHLLIDVREESEFAAGHVRGAIHLSKGIIERDIETAVPDKNTTLILYCGGGYRSALVADNLTKMGYLNSISLEGGWRALKESGFPTEP